MLAFAKHDLEDDARLRAQRDDLLAGARGFARFVDHLLMLYADKRGLSFGKPSSANAD